MSRKMLLLQVVIYNILLRSRHTDEEAARQAKALV
jgi:hypothetical protein